MNTDAISRDRFREWRQVLREHNATPAVLVAIGHERTTGEVHVVTVEDLTTREVIGFLTFALEDLLRQAGGGV